MADSTPDITALLDSWELDLKTQKKSPHTIGSYLDGVTAYLRWCDRAGRPRQLDKEAVQLFMVALQQAKAADSTVYSRFTSCRIFAKWLVEEGELPTDPLAGMKPPAIDEQLVDPLSDDEIKAMLKACDGKEFTDRRDEAIIRFMVESAARAREVARMLLKETKVIEGTAVIRGKGGKERLVPFSPYTARAIDRYLRLRRTHPLADTDRLWLGGKGRTFDYPGLYYSLGQRADAAGIVDFHPHRLRHTGADRWLAAGGTEGGLMTVAGWDSEAMLRRYTKRRSAIRAIEEAQRLNLGDF